MDIVPLRELPSKHEARNIIRKLVSEGKVKFHLHTKKRPEITTPQILNCLKKGEVVEEPTQNLSDKGWQTAVEGRAAGSFLRVVVCMRWSQDLLVITSYCV